MVRQLRRQERRVWPCLPAVAAQGALPSPLRLRARRKAPVPVCSLYDSNGRLDLSNPSGHQVGFPVCW
jgi:hypothetical protein